MRAVAERDPKAAAGAPAVEQAVALHMVKLAVVVVPVVLLVAAALSGTDGVVSAGLAVALVLVNLVVSAASMSWAAKVSLTMLMAVAMGGFAVRMGLVTLLVWLVKDEPWIDLPTLGISILVTHLGLLFWELRYVSASLAYPGLKPGTAKEVRPS